MEPTTSAGMLVHCAGCIMCLGSKVDREAGGNDNKGKEFALKKQSLEKGILIKPRAVFTMCFGH